MIFVRGIWKLSPKEQNRLHLLKPGSELINKSIECFNKLRPFFGDCLQQMNTMKHLDLESRKGKAPGDIIARLPKVALHLFL